MLLTCETTVVMLCQAGLSLIFNITTVCLETFTCDIAWGIDINLNSAVSVKKGSKVLSLACVLTSPISSIALRGKRMFV